MTLKALNFVSACFIAPLLRKCQIRHLEKHVDVSMVQGPKLRLLHKAEAEIN